MSQPPGRLPPGVLAPRLVRVFPQFTLCDATLSALLGSYLQPTANPAMSDFLQWLQNNPGSAAAAGDILNPPGKPRTSAAPLDAALVFSLLKPLTSTASWVIAQPAFEGVAWMLLQGVAPGPETPRPVTDAWSLSTLAPLGSLIFSEIAWSGPAPGVFNLSLMNDQPRHLAVYASFSAGGTPVVPSDWTSQLPLGAPAAFESQTVKYVGVLRPNASVSGIPVDRSAQTIAFTMPANADTASLLFGGVGGAGFSAIPDAAGVLLTFVLDMFVPWVVAGSGQAPSDLGTWFDGVLADPKLVADVLASGGFLTTVSGSDAMFAAVSANLTGVVLGQPLRRLRDSIADELGAPHGKDYSWVDQFAPAAGWAAQLVELFVAGGLNAQYWAASTPSTLTLVLSAATSVALDVILEPDPISGIWPYAAASWSLTIVYAGGFSQTQTGQMPPAPSSAPLTVSFGDVRNAGPVDVSARLRDGSGAVVAEATTRVVPPTAADPRLVSVRLAVTDAATTIDATTQYQRVARLTFAAGAYAWSASGRESSAVGLGPGGGGAPALTSLNSLTLQGARLCLGYAWGASNQATTVCGGGTPLTNAYFIQDIGTAMPASQLKTIDCGLVAAPRLVYSPFGQDEGMPQAGGYYIDTQGAGIFLRPVTFEPGTFDLQSASSVGQIPPQASLGSLCLHPAGYAAAVSPDQNLLQIVALASEAVADAQSPMAIAYGGGGRRVGLLNNPVGVAVTPDGSFIVLEQGNSRVQAFDVGGNSMPLFNGQAVFPLRSVPGPVYCDIAVSPHGFIYVLGGQNGRTTAGDCFLDIYNPDGTLLNSTAGVNAAKLAVDASHTMYSLDYDALTGLGGRTEPVLSVWRPGS